MAETSFVDKRTLQHELFHELSDMFGREVPMYDRSLLINTSCNRAVCSLLAELYHGFEVSDEQIDAAGGERHGAIRIGRSDEYHWIGRYFACFAMEPHSYFDMTSVGVKSQPIIATGFRSTIDPDHRVFASLLQTNFFEDSLQARIEALLDKREIFPARAKSLIEQSERDGGLGRDDADELIRCGTEHIFQWRSEANDPELYYELCDAGFKIAADIACFTTHHLNHLTPNTLCMDLYTAAMRLCMGEIDGDRFRTLAARALGSMTEWMDHHGLVLHFKHIFAEAGHEQIQSYPRCELSEDSIQRCVDRLFESLNQPEHDLSSLGHHGYKDYTEGPSAEAMVLLRQDAYKALTETVEFIREDGSVVSIDHTARFGEIEQRSYATTKKGRLLYDECLTELNHLLAEDPSLPERDPDRFVDLRSSVYARFPRTLEELLDQGLVYGQYSPTVPGLKQETITEGLSLGELIASGFVQVEGLRYEDFLPMSAAGIFASNLNQYGTKSSASSVRAYPQRVLEEILGRSIIDTDVIYSGLEARSVLVTFEALGLQSSIDQDFLGELNSRTKLLESQLSQV
ncbi:MAG: DUF1338 family protein [Phycisphaerales bacterium]